VWQRAHPDARIVAWAGNGNLLTNPHFIGYADKTLYALGREPLGARSYSCLVVRRGNVSIETLRAGDFGGDIECATFGQQVVRNGDPIDREQLARKASAGEFADLRHVFLFPRINLGPERWIDAGLAAFYRYNGEMDRRSIERALYAQPVTADVRQFREGEVRRALAEKGYRYYELRGGVLKFVPLPGIYPHSLIGIRRDGTLLAVAVAGLSNRTGMTIEGAGLLMAELGARDALIIDNGADVGLGVGDEALVNGRDRLRSVLFFHGGETDLPRVRHFESSSFQSVRPAGVSRNT
jgi:hypothetical protein